MDKLQQGLGQVIGQERKEWNNKTNEEKLQTLREELRNSRYLIRRIVDLENKLRKLEEHSHIDGKVVVPIGLVDYRNDCSTGGYDSLA